MKRGYKVRWRCSNMSNDIQPEIRFPGFTDEWEQVKLKDVATVFDGTHQTPKYTESGVKFVSVENIKTLETEKYISQEAYDSEYSKKQAEKGDVLMTRIGDIGTAKVIETDEPLAYYVTLALLKPNEIDSSFLAWLISSPEVQRNIWKRTLHIAFPKKINLGEINQIEMNVPSLEEQTKIGTFFKQIDNTITLHQRKLDLLKETKKGFLQKMFPKNGAKVPEIRFPGFTEDWEDREFSEIVKTTGYKAYLSEAFEVGEYPVIQQGDKPILGYSDKKPFENFEDVVLFGDHTLSLYKPETPFLVATDGLKIITVPNFSGSFLLSLLEKYVPESQGYKRHFTILKKEQVAFPTDVKERVLIGEFFTQIDRTITLHERELDLLKETKKGLLQKMFV
ncbi:restriction endonuclease subunit S [Enterococcus faecium]|nr:restriction endonuclease subunit S [Enterococcus faecium]